MALRPLLLATLLVAVTSIPALAKLGMTPEEAEQKYGAPKGDIQPVEGADKAKQFASSNELYNLHFKNDKLVMAQVAGKRTPLSIGSSNGILKDFEDGSQWRHATGQQNVWMTQNGLAKAELDLKRGQLFIYDSQWQMSQFLTQGKEAEFAGPAGDKKEGSEGESSGDSLNGGGVSANGETKSNTIIYKSKNKK